MRASVHNPPRKILIIDHNRDSRELLVRALKRKFSQAELVECEEAGGALVALATQNFDVTVLHRTFEVDAVSLVMSVRQVAEGMPIIVVSGVDRSEAVLKAGATAFLNYDEWLMLGNVVEKALAATK